MINLTNIYLDTKRTHALVSYEDYADRSYYYHIPLANVHALTLNQTYIVQETYSGKVRYINFKQIDPSKFIDKDVTSSPKWSELVTKSEQETDNKTINASEILGISIPTGEPYGTVYYRNGTTSKMSYLEIHQLIMDNNLDYILTKRVDEEWLSII